MPRVTFIAHDGTRHAVDVDAGESLMRAAVDNGVPGIDADCGGMCACATCHVFVEPEWVQRLAAPSQQEEEMLNFTAERRASSRLACQIPVVDALDGLTVTMPEGQH
jgi:2Fe-2S ferredoxin